MRDSFLFRQQDNPTAVITTNPFPVWNSPVSDWYRKSVAEVTEQFECDPQTGLSAEEAARRLERHGPNELTETGGRGPWRIIWEQFSSAMVVMLIAAAVVSLLLQETTDAIAIFTIVILNAALGFFQDYRAERAMAALKQLAVPTVVVRRNGAREEISARKLVPGDIVLLEAGNLAPADARLVNSQNLRAQEASLTGESEPVSKSTDALSEDDLGVGDRTNMVFMGTIVTYGRGEAVVTGTGMETELGHIADMLQTVSSDSTPLQRRLAQLGRWLAVAALVIVAVVFGLGLARGEPVKLMFMTALSMAVAAVPEGLPAVATVALALGARRMLKRQALIRKLPAVETLGSVTVICSDKTGTLTENVMTVAVVDLAGRRIDISESDSGVDPPEETQAPIKEQAAAHPALALLMAGSDLCNDAELETKDEESKEPESLTTVGDPTEGALVVAAARLGWDKSALEASLPRVAEVPFDSDRKRMTTIHRLPEAETEEAAALRQALAAADVGQFTYVSFTKGAVDSLVAECSHVWEGDRPEPINEDWRARISAGQAQLAGDGMRVLGVAFRLLKELPGEKHTDDAEHELTFIGMVGMIDPARSEVPAAVQRAKTAGIRAMMITGDHPLTALHIAGQLGIAEGDTAITGSELAKMSAEELQTVVKDNSVYARVSPEHKLRIVEALQDQGEIVAMTGDGVNDAPALKKADIGVAMGITGTDVSKEASEFVLLDDNFATIVNAVEEGRVVYDNIRKFVKYTMTSNTGEIWAMLLGPFLGMPLPLLPLQILWINLVTDGLPGLALAVEGPERNTMRRSPYPPGESVFARGVGRDILWVGLLMGLVSLAVGYFYWRTTAPPSNSEEVTASVWQTMLFTTLTLSQMGVALAVRSDRESLFRIGLLTNKVMLGAVLLTFGLQMAVVYAPPMQAVFRTVALSPVDLLICLASSATVFWAIEAQKWFLPRSS